MNTLKRLRCAISGRHKYEWIAEHEVEGNSKYVNLFTCERCGQDSWSYMWKGEIGPVALWNRALTQEEIR